MWAGTLGLKGSASWWGPYLWGGRLHKIIASLVGLKMKFVISFFFRKSCSLHLLLKQKCSTLFFSKSWFFYEFMHFALSRPNVGAERNNLCGWRQFEFDLGIDFFNIILSINFLNCLTILRSWMSRRLSQPTLGQMQCTSLMSRQFFAEHLLTFDNHLSLWEIMSAQLLKILVFGLCEETWVTRNNQNQTHHTLKEYAVGYNIMTKFLSVVKDLKS